MGEGNFEDYGMRMYNTRLGRFFNVDPLTKSYPELTPYQFASDSPIQNIDLDGLEGSWAGYLNGVPQNQHANVIKGIRQEHKKGAIAFVTTVAGILDAVYTRGTGMKVLAGAGLLESINETERGHEAQADGNYGEAHRRYANAGEASKFAIFEGVGTGIAFAGGKVLGVVSKVKDELVIAFGKNINLKPFAIKNNAISFHNFDDIPGYTGIKDSFTSFEDAFKFSTESVINTGGKIKFNLEYVNIQKAMQIKPGTGLYEQVNGQKSLWEEGLITEWELSKVLNDKKLLKSTEFYKMGKEVPASTVVKMAKK